MICIHYEKFTLTLEKPGHQRLYLQPATEQTAFVCVMSLPSHAGKSSNTLSPRLRVFSSHSTNNINIVPHRTSTMAAQTPPCGGRPKEPPTLSQRIQALPQELQGHILEHVVAIPPNQTTIITLSHRPPWQLSFNRATREKVAKPYYASTIFALASRQMNGGPSDCSKINFYRWLKSLPKEHRAEIQRIRRELQNQVDDEELRRNSRCLLSLAERLLMMAQSGGDWCCV